MTLCHQPSLLATTPRARASDPETSHTAADELLASGELGDQQHEVLDWVRKHPGLTTAEYAEKKADRDGGTWQQYRPMFGRRMKELQPVYVQTGRARKCWVTGTAESKRKCLTYYPTNLVRSRASAKRGD